MTKNPLLIAVVGFVLAAFGFYHFALSPKRAEASKAEAKLSEAQNRLQTAQALLATNLTAKRSYKRSFATVVRLGKAVPADDDVRSLMIELTSAAKRTHVDFQAINVGGDTVAATGSSAPSSIQLPPGASVGPAGFPIMPFEFTFRGGFFRLGAYFSRLERLVRARNDEVDVNGRLLTIDGIKLEPDTTGFPNVKATVKATSYLVSPLEGATGGATATGPSTTTETATPGGGSSSGSATTPPTTTATIR